MGALPGILPDPAIGTRLSFRLVYPDVHAAGGGGGRGAMGGRLDGEAGRGRYVSKEMGSVVIAAPRGDSSGENGGGGLSLEGDDADRTLEDVRFVIGDYVDCAVFPPLSDGSVVSRGSVSGSRGGLGSRENGYGRVRSGGYGLGGGGRGGYSGGGSRGEFGGPGSIPSGEWRRGERLPDTGGYRGGGRGGGRNRPY